MYRDHKQLQCNYDKPFLVIIDSPIGVDTSNGFTNNSGVLLNFPAINGVSYDSVDPESINAYTICEKGDNVYLTTFDEASEFC